jgi:chorismate lyase/3-hydroxybenzoate synthase
MAATAPSFGPDLSVSFEAHALPESVPGQELFRFRFGKDLEDDGADNTFRLHIEPVGYAARDEIWHTSRPIAIGRSDGFAYAECEQHLAAHIEIDPNPADNFRELTANAYYKLLSLAKQRGYPNLIRTWNFFPQINQGFGDQERYKLFSAGRAIAFEEFGYRGQMLPAGTAIGTDPGTPFTISAIATRENCRTVENPRQTSAYNYPRDYGPKSPSFSRAVTVAAPGGNKILISGTASIVGHESRHEDNPERQMLETLQNLENLIQQAKDVTQSRVGGKQIFDCHLRVYIRSKEQIFEIQRALKEQLAGDHHIIFLRGDICRRELLVEVEAACKI